MLFCNQKPRHEGLFLSEAEASMAVEEFLDPAVDPALDVIRCPRYLRVTDKGEEIGKAVLDQTPDGPEFLVRVPPAAPFVLHIPVASFGQEAMVLSSPVSPATNPAAFLPSSSDRRQLLDEPAKVLASHCFWMEGELGEGHPEDVNKTSLKWHCPPAPAYRCKEPALAITNDRSRQWQA